MSIALICDTQTEVRRLLIAGSELAAGDFRLLKLLPGLKKAGESVPVFARVAECIEKVVEPGQGKAERLLDLANIVNAIIYTQGETSLAGEIQDVDTLDVNNVTHLSYRQLSPIIEALSTKGSGRYEIIKAACEKGTCNDFRLINPLFAALDDGYGEIACLAQEMLKGYDRGIIPLLKNKLDLNGGTSAVRILELISFYDSIGEKILYVEALEKGSIEVRVAAINALKKFPECEATFLELVSDRKKEIREAALNALAHFNSLEAGNGLFRAFKGKDRQISMWAVKNSKAAILLDLLLEEAEQVLAAVLLIPQKQEKIDAGEKLPEQKTVDYFFDILECLEGKEGEAVFSFLKKCLEHIPQLARFKHSSNNRNFEFASTLARSAAEVMLMMESDKALNFLVSQEKTHNNHLLRFSFIAALKSCSPEYVFDNYSTYAVDKRKNHRQEILSVWKGYCDINEEEIIIDERWLKVFIINDEVEIVCRFIPAGSSTGIYYLLKYIDNKKNMPLYRYEMVIRGLVKAKYEKISEIMESKLKSMLTGRKSDYLYHYNLRQFLRMTPIIGADFAMILEKAAVDCDADTAAIIQETIYDLKNSQ
ncbi:MAG: hypothetical protein H6Q73_2852 [Firmicutes bacterium]|nr:hypothetical protein [Bacillota bacterium]